MSVQAIKVGGLYTAETASVAAQIAADYSQVPLVLHLGQRAQLPPTDAADEDDADDLLAATLELVLPQTDLLVIEHLRLAQWHADGDIDIGDAPTPMHALVAAGAQWVLVLGSPQRPGHYANVLLGPGGQTSTYPWQAPPDRNGDAGGLAATAITAMLARGLEMPRPCGGAWPRRRRRRLQLPAWHGPAHSLPDPTAMKALRFPAGLYGVTPEWDDTERLLQAGAPPPKAACALQRAPQERARRRARRGRALAPLYCRELGVVFLINDDWKLALEVGADNAHGPRRRQPGAHPRRGRPRSGWLQLRRPQPRPQHSDAGADYIAFGAMFASTVKPRHRARAAVGTD